MEEKPQNSLQFIVPEKRINSGEDFEKWRRSNVQKAYVQYILDLNESIKGKSLSAPCQSSPVIFDFFLKFLLNS